MWYEFPDLVVDEKTGSALQDFKHVGQIGPYSPNQNKENAKHE